MIVPGNETSLGRNAFVGYEVGSGEPDVDRESPQYLSTSETQ